MDPFYIRNLKIGLRWPYKKRKYRVSRDFSIVGLFLKYPGVAAMEVDVKWMLDCRDIADLIANLKGILRFES